MPIYDPTNETYAHPVRYIRDSVNGSTANGSSHWVEIQALDSSGNNIAQGKTVKLVSGTTEGQSTSIVTDGATATGSYLGAQGTNPTVEIDLGAIYDIANIKVWHYYGDGRTYYSPVTKVSSNGSTWTTISNGSTYAETSSGKTWSCSKVASQQVLVHHQIGKVYDNNGTTNSQIGKVYDNNGTTNSLIYNAEVIVFDKDTGVGAGTWKAWNYSGHGGDSWNYGGSNTSSGVFVRTDNSYTAVTEQVQRDFSQFSKVTFTITQRSAVGSWLGTTRFGISTKSLNYISGNVSNKYVDITKTGTFELDLSTYNDLGYLCLTQDTGGYITMDDIILE